MVFSIVLVSLLVLLSGCQGAQSKEKAVQEAVEGYLNALPAHDVQEIKKYVNADWQDDLANEEYVVAFVDTVVSCESIEVDTEQIKEIGNNQVEVPVKYVLTYSEDYIPVGTLEIAHMRDALQQ